MAEAGREFDVIVQRCSDGDYVASVPALHGCQTRAASLDELMERLEEAVALYLDIQGDSTPALEFVGIQRVRLPGTAHRD